MSVDVRGSDRCEFYYYAATLAQTIDTTVLPNYAEGLHFSAFHYRIGLDSI